MALLNLLALVAISFGVMSSSSANIVQQYLDADWMEEAKKIKDGESVLRTRREEGDNLVQLGVVAKPPDTCESMPKKMFNNVDYSLMGYDILRGYPLSLGRDPGFRDPIFTASYNPIRYNSDCRYIIPNGLKITHDVSCSTSFSSKEVKSSSQLKKALAVSANVEGSGWGASFSASAGYKQTKDTVKNAQSIIILSEASCKYFYVKHSFENPPPLDNDFKASLVELNNADGEQDSYMAFLERYGTHYLKEINYGARYVFQHNMSLSDYSSASSKDVSVAVQAGYSGSFSVSGGFSLDSSQQDAASEFSKMVETKTVTIGATPPANGDAMTWASTVKENAMPMEYTLAQIDQLFSPKYMSGIAGISEAQISTMKGYMKTALDHYCDYLKCMGEIYSCEGTDDFSIPTDYTLPETAGTYQVSVRTRRVSKAGTSGTASITIVGSEATCADKPLDSLHLKYGNTDTTTMTCDPKVGEIESVTLKITGDDNWKVRDVVIIDPHEKFFTLFKFDTEVTSTSPKSSSDPSHVQYA